MNFPRENSKERPNYNRCRPSLSDDVRKSHVRWQSRFRLPPICATSSQDVRKECNKKADQLSSDLRFLHWLGFSKSLEAARKVNRMEERRLMEKIARLANDFHRNTTRITDNQRVVVKKMLDEYPDQEADLLVLFKDNRPLMRSLGLPRSRTTEDAKQ